MESICLLTDGTAQFATNTFRGSEHIYSIVPDIAYEQKKLQAIRDVKASDLPLRSFLAESPHLRIPDLSEVCETITSLAGKYSYLIAILASHPVNPLFDVIEKAVTTNHGRIKSQLIHSQAGSSGLGIMLETAAAAIMDGLSPAEIEHRVRKLIPHVYTTVCTSGWSYLFRSGLVDHAQAEVGEMLGLVPIFTLEEGGMSPIQKVRADHSIFEYFQEFLDEFEELEQITFLHHDQILRQDADSLHDHIREAFPHTKFSENLLNTTNAIIFGPRTLSLTVIEKTGA
ncbi:MAG: DegV family protein [Anaerolineaceae bacterium]